VNDINDLEDIKSRPQAEASFTIDEDDKLIEDKPEAINDLDIKNIKNSSDIPDISDIKDEDPNTAVQDPKVIRKHRKFKFNIRFTKKNLIVIGAVLAIIIALILIYLLVIKPNNDKSYTSATTSKKTTTKAVVKPTLYYSSLTGNLITKAQSLTPITAVMIENSDDARPQSGLSQAGIVFEALAEGGITRFMALFQENQPSSIGPIRSARPYFIDWMLPFDAAYAHVGGSPAGLSEISSLGVKDMDEFYNGNYYTRITSRDAPHNVYTSISSLLSLEQSKDWTSSNATGFTHKTDAPLKVPTASSIDLNISSSDMEVHYQYDAAKNSYLRSEGGAAMIDALNNQQIEPKVVIAMIVPWTNGALDSSDAYYTDYSDIGSGSAYVFQDGGVTVDTWTKSAQTSQIQFTSSTGAVIKLNAGQTWITAVGDSSLVTYK
jgi:hypothetical protein